MSQLKDGDIFKMYESEPKEFMGIFIANSNPSCIDNVWGINGKNIMELEKI